MGTVSDSRDGITGIRDHAVAVCDLSAAGEIQEKTALHKEKECIGRQTIMHSEN